MSKTYKSYDEELKKTLVSLYENGKKYLIYQENMALMNLLLDLG